ncbi:MAG: CBS domain-containing protein [Myxococcaceae bacterium]
MTDGAESIRPDEPSGHALDRMKALRIHHLVVKEGKSIVGIVSARDLADDNRAGAKRSGSRVADLMTSHPICVEPNTPVQRAANLLRGRSIGSLPVVEDGRLVGIVTVSDLLELVGRGPAPKPLGRVDHTPHRRVSRPVTRSAAKPR